MISVLPNVLLGIDLNLYYLEYMYRHSLLFLLIFVFTALFSCNKNQREQPNEILYNRTSNTFDTTYASASRFVHLKNGLVLENKDSCFLLERDMLYNRSQLEELSELSTETYHPRTESVSSLPVYWAGRVVPYEFDSTCSSSFQTHANAAMSSISSNCGVRFIPATYQTDKIVFHYSSSGNNSYVGKVGGAQIINIHSYTSSGTIVHEILHALGFYHEHSRNDRDNYLVINWNNIKNNMEYAFYKHSIGLCTTPLDTTSIMMYGSITNDTGFVYDTTVPMLTGLSGELISWHNSLSSTDIQDLRGIYGPPYHKMSVYRETLNDYYEYGTEIYEEEVTYTICFYSDEAYTTPTTLTNSRSIIIRETTTYCDVFQQMHTTTRDYVVTVPSGYSSYLIGTHINYEYYAYGSPSHIDIVSYSIINYH